MTLPPTPSEVIRQLRADGEKLRDQLNAALHKIALYQETLRKIRRMAEHPTQSRNWNKGDNE